MSVLRFLAVGIGNTAVGLGVIVTAQAWLGFSPLAANAFGYAVAIPLGFALNRRWTFGHEGSTTPALLRYAAVLAVAYAVNVVTLLAFKGAAYGSQFAGMIAYTSTSYLGMRFLVFRAAREK